MEQVVSFRSRVSVFQQIDIEPPQFSAFRSQGCRGVRKIEHELFACEG